MILAGEALEQLRTLPAESVQCCVTSPPYYGLRDYGVDAQIGLEASPAEYIDKLVAVFREVRRVLRKDGVAWVNMGDSYASGGRATYRSGASENKGYDVQNEQARPIDPPGIKPKDLMGMPWRLAFALQADGWYLRQDIIWAKPNPMPESATDRCTKAHEYIFLLSKSERYYYDAAAISEECVVGYRTNPKGVPMEGRKSASTSMWRNAGDATTPVARGSNQTDATFDSAWRRNKRSVWTIATEPYPDAHFATFPTELPRLCILAGSKAGDTILDPFNGSGTTGQVALELAREYIGIELNPAYVALTEKRLSRVTPGLAFA